MDENPEPETLDLQQLADRSPPADRSIASDRSPGFPDRLLSAVANEQRRTILTALTDAAETTLDFDALVDRVAATLRDDGAKRVSEDHRRRVRIALHHAHLPKLAAARLIEYETETGRVRFVGGDRERAFLALFEPYDE